MYILRSLRVTVMVQELLRQNGARQDSWHHLPSRIDN